MSMERLIELRFHKLKSGSGATFHSLVSETSVPLMQAAGMVVVAYGQSLHDPYHDLNRPGFCRHLGAMENGLIGGVYEQQAVHG